jgi:hypothetical protein
MRDSIADSRAKLVTARVTRVPLAEPL